MSEFVYYGILVALIFGVMVGIALMSKVEQAAKGNLLTALCTVAAILLALYRYDALTVISVWITLGIGTVVGLVGAHRVKMIQMPQTVAILNGFGGCASAFVAIVALSVGGISVFEIVTAGLALCIGMLTLTGSLIAAGKLHNVLKQKPTVWPGHQMLTVLSVVLMLAAVIAMPIVGIAYHALLFILVLLVLSGFFGIAFAIRVGGADMPITISLLNSLSGIAVSAAGMTVSDPLLVAVGAIIGAAGLILTQIMCRAMNRTLSSIIFSKAAADAPAKPKAPSAAPAPVAKAAPVASAPNPQQVLADAKSVIIVPGYGMALAQAQGLVKQLSDTLESKGVDVKYAIHPVAGRMPGHMNVLLAEVDVPYDKLHEIDDINPQFENCDAVVVIGANDVVNPAAHTAVDTPIYGMPILDVEKAKNIIICNFDTKPGYAGVPNPLYEDGQSILMLGDAKESIGKLLQAPQAETAAAEAAPATGGPNPQQVLADAKSVIIVPGYGMALAQAQGLVKQLSDTLESKGVDVKYAIHPVAGRMPGHMNVLLAEVDVPYDKLCEIDDINPQFENCDAVVVIGANDVVNPAAYTAEDTPIYGMPILDVAKAKSIIICNYDTNPGYAGVPNPLYEDGQAILMLGDAKESISKLLQAPQAAPAAEAAPATGGADPKQVLTDAKNVIIVPGYGMALAQAQGLVKQLSDKLEAKGVDVKYAIHPVAGRMPGHMNVLLAEVDVPYDKLCEIDDINPEFENCDAVVVIGANDVVNPAAYTAVDTPIYGMPILDVAKAKNIIICNYDTNPGYAGVPNPLYEDGQAILMLGDAKESIGKLL